MGVNNTISPDLVAGSADGGRVADGRLVVDAVEQNSGDSKVDDAVIVVHLRIPGGYAAGQNVLKNIGQLNNHAFVAVATPWGEFPVSYAYAYSNELIRLRSESYVMHKAFEASLLDNARLAASLATALTNV